MTDFDEDAFMEQGRLEAEREFGIKIDPIEWSAAPIQPRARSVAEVMGRLSKVSEGRLKVQLMLLIVRAVEGLGLTQVRVAELTGLSQPDVSNLVRGRRFNKFSVFRLLEVLLSLGGTVSLKVEGPKQALPEGAVPVGKLSLEAV